MKISSVIVGVVVLVLVGIMVMNVHERITRLEARVEAAEGALAPLRPLGDMIGSVRPGPQAEGAYEAKQATGAPNVPGGQGDSALAWCPGKEDAGMEWVRLEYAEEVMAVEVRVYENLNPGAVVALLVVSEDGTEEVLEVRPSGGGGDAGQWFVLEEATAIKALKLRLDTAKVPGWNEIDAVGLMDAAGVEHWGVEAEASGAWKRE